MTAIKLRHLAAAILCIVAWAIPLAAKTSSSQVCVEKNCYPRVATIAEKEVPLRGAALLRFWGFHIYTAGYYEGNRSADAPPSRKLVLNYLRTITKKDIVRATEKGIEKNPDANRAELAERLDLLYSAYVDVRKGDSYEIVYTPGTGTAVSFNGTLKVTIPGDDFADAFIGIWVSEHALSQSLRDKLTSG